MKKIYIILSYSGTFPSKIVKLFTRYEYSHVSLAIDANIKTMYSFARKKVYNPFDGGFVLEDKNGKFYRKFNKTKCTIFELDVTNKQYKNLLKILNNYERNISVYKYDFMGLFLSVFNIKFSRKNYKICSEFVRELLEKSDIYKFEEKLVKPKHFLEIPNKRLIYKGNLLNY